MLYDPQLLAFALLCQHMWYLLTDLVGHDFCGLLVRMHVQGVDLVLFGFLSRNDRRLHSGVSGVQELRPESQNHVKMTYMSEPRRRERRIRMRRALNRVPVKPPLQYTADTMPQKGPKMEYPVYLETSKLK